MTGAQRKIATKPCQDCPALISANGGCKRCADCQHRERKRLDREKKQRRRQANAEVQA